MDGFEGLDKARVNVPDIGSLTIVPEGQYISHRDELKKTDKLIAPKEKEEETDSAAEEVEEAVEETPEEEAEDTAASEEE